MAMRNLANQLNQMFQKDRKHDVSHFLLIGELAGGGMKMEGEQDVC